MFTARISAIEVENITGKNDQNFLKKLNSGNWDALLKRVKEIEDRAFDSVSSHHQ